MIKSLNIIIFFAKTFGCVRFTYNRMLEDRIKAYEESKGNHDEKIKYPTPVKYKKEFEFLKEVDSLAFANAKQIGRASCRERVSSPV